MRGGDEMVEMKYLVLRDGWNFHSWQHPGWLSGFKTKLTEHKIYVGKIKLIRFERYVVAR